ncbi:N-acetyltransferase [Sinobaca sp. H24]|uniref:N-acetyltransferase n=1 Tax=Sinobaca sp. H24 TaxID=2923376 RepID=UPI00207AAE16|nr:N-acetyltransferase [Sinobaca sp. H24]
MNIRTSKETEIDELVEIWHEGSLKAHDFIDSAYWTSQREAMKETYLPLAENYVLCRNDTEIVGFVSIVDNVYLAALFIDSKHQGEGYGRALLDFVKEQYKQLQLKVYKKNERAGEFYQRNEFIIKEEQIEEKTGEAEFVMEWIKA